MQRAHVLGIPAHHRFRRHEHPGVHLCAVVSGSFSERNGRTWTTVDPGSVRISRAARHDIDFGPAGATCLLLEPTDLDLPFLRRARFLEPDPWLGQLVARCAAANELRAESAFGLDDASTELWAQVLRRLAGRKTPAPAWLRRVPELVNDTAEPIGVAAIAAAIGVHRVHLARVFRDHKGLSVSAYVQRIRLERARRLLMRGREPLADVAFAAGFSDQSHMTRAVRRAFGVTPGALRGPLHPFKTRSGRRG